MLVIKQILEEIQKFINECLGMIFSIPKIFLLSSFFTKTSKAKSAKAAILGNGPSLNNSIKNHLSFILDCEIYCVNNFASYQIYEEIKPDNYVLLDNAFYEYSPTNNAHKIVEKTIFSFTKTDWPMNIYLPIAAKNSFIVQQLKLNPYHSIYFFNYTLVNGFTWWKHFLYKANLAMPKCQNILAASLFIAIQREHQEVFIFGADHSWHEEIVLINNEITMTEDHFYSSKSITTKLESLPKSVNKIYKFFDSISKAFYSYEQLRSYAQFKKVKVLNASSKSYIDAFEKIDLNTIK